MSVYAVQANVYGSIDLENYEGSVVVFFNKPEVTKSTPSWNRLNDSTLETMATPSSDGSFKCSPLVFKVKTEIDPAWEFNIIKYNENDESEIVGPADVNYRKIVTT